MKSRRTAHLQVPTNQSTNKDYSKPLSKAVDHSAQRYQTGMNICRKQSWSRLMLSVSATYLVFLATHLSAAASDAGKCACKPPRRPEIAEKAKTARWIVHSLDFLMLATISSRLQGRQGKVTSVGEDSAGSLPIPFGNIYSFADGPCNNATGTPYIYGTFMDQSFVDSVENYFVSMTFTEASLSSVCANHHGISSCMIGTKYGDPENPVCARLTLTGQLIVLDDHTEEYKFAQQALFQRHPTMEGWPTDHGWVIAKIDIEDIWYVLFLCARS